MAQPRPSKNDREQWYVKNNTNRTLAISDVLTIPAIGPGKTLDILRFATREQISYSSVLPKLVKSGKVTLRKSIPNSGIDDIVTADTVDAAIVPRQYADGEHVENAESAGASTIGELEDIDLTGLGNDQVLQYDAAAQIWRPVDLSVLGSYGSSDFSNDFALRTTTDLAEGSNLYYTQGRFDTAFSAKSTSDLTEGSNLYYTDERVDDRIASILRVGIGIGWVYDDNANTLTATITLAPFDTDDLAEGSNLYYTTARARSSISASAPISYNSTTGQITFDGSGFASVSHTHVVADITDFPTLAGVATSGAYSDLSGIPSLAIVATSGNYSDLNGIPSAFTPSPHIHTASQITDFSEAVDDRVSLLIQDGTGITWTYVDAAGTLTANISLTPFSTDDLSEGSNLYYTQARFDTAFAAKSTDDLAEGSNEFYTAEKVDDRVAALLVEGTNVSIVYDDIAGTLTISSSGGPGGGASALGELNDVDTSSAANGNVLTYVGAADEWRPASPVAAGSRNPDVIAYNPDGSISQIDFDDDSVVTFGYSGGRLETITEGSTVKTLQYNGDGQLTGIVVS
jgi:hypothetical protein